MFIQVRLLKGFSEPLLYEVPPAWHDKELVGKIVRVPLRAQTYSALVIKQFTTKPASSFTIKQAQEIEPFPDDKFYQPFIQFLSAYYQVEALHFIKRLRTFIEQKEVRERMSLKDKPAVTSKITLTDEQQKVVNFLAPHITKPSFKPVVLHGVTGSGKTEVYKRLITQAIEKNKTVLLLLPEVTLALQFEKLLRTQLPSEINLYGFHSASTPKDKRSVWKALLEKKPILIIGVHLPILLPLPNVGLIIIDEEHEAGYQEKKHPKVNSKEAAIVRASLHNIPILLGSATPSLSSLYNVKTKGWNFFQLKNRFAGNFPSIETVFLGDKKQRRNFWISQKLEHAIKDRLEKKEQVIIFLNRRGFSFFVQCRACSHIFECRNCSVSLTLHDGNHLTCHYCGIAQQVPKECPKCKASESQFLKKGIGTQQVVSILQALFPYARIARADMDTTLKKKVWQQTLQDFEQGTIDILVGTQTITKGFHFPRVTLVGILWADLNLHFPIYNAAETTLQQLIQVAGRAGRQHTYSNVIVQAMADHAIFQFLNELDYIKFYAHEMKNRKTLLYPPFSRLIEIELKHIKEELLEREATRLVHYLLSVRAQTNVPLQILGPAKPPVSKIKKIHMRKIYIKGQNIHELEALFHSIDQRVYKSNLFFTPNPTS